MNPKLIYPGKGDNGTESGYLKNIDEWGFDGMKDTSKAWELLRQY